MVGCVGGVLLLILVAAASAPDALASSPDCGLSTRFEDLHTAAPELVGECVDDPTGLVNGDALQHTTNGLLVWNHVEERAEFTDGSSTWILGEWWIDHPHDPGIKVALVRRRNDQRFSWESDAYQPGEQTITWASCPSINHPNVIDGSWAWCAAGPTRVPPSTDVF